MVWCKTNILIGEIKLLDINEIKFYGIWDSEEEREYEFWWWYSTIDQEVYSVEQLLENFSFDNYNSILNSYDYIPLWKTDERRLIHDFIVNELKDKTFYSFLSDPQKSFYHYCSSNDNYITRWWDEYEDVALLNDAIKWCKMHGIPYR